ncbi:MAG: helix-turn-helix transcriptional regulator, partial [Solirubrobacterales bacterium]|nr:helix-turn-helix transcriptional regulator [Solirubrobacterales bacterium]
MTAWLLLLLGGGESYGWALLAALRERGLSVDQSSAYRTLRHLERDGAAASHWMDSSGGPRRRAYRLTPAGRRT